MPKIRLHLTKTLVLRATPDEAKAFERAALTRGMTLSAWIRFVCRRQAGLDKGKE